MWGLGWQSLDITVSILGSGHPDVAATLSNMGAVMEKLNRTAQADDYYRQVTSPLCTPQPHTLITPPRHAATRLLLSHQRLVTCVGTRGHVLACHVRVNTGRRLLPALRHSHFE